MSWYSIIFKSGQFETTPVYAKSASAAKYKYWLKFRDVYNVSFGMFLTMVKCRKVREEEHGQPKG